jgi:hypothetical protein
VHWSDTGIAVATGDNSFLVQSCLPQVLPSSYMPRSLTQVLVREEAGWVVKWRENSAHALDVNCVEWAGQHTLVTAGCSMRRNTIFLSFSSCRG